MTLPTLVVTAAVAVANLVSSTTYYQAPYQPINRVVTVQTVDEKLDFYADKFGADANKMRAVIDCENKEWDTNLQSRNKYPKNNAQWGVKAGETEQSFGLVQIHLPDWPEITKEQAINPDFALDFMAKKFSEGKEEFWSCYNLLKKQGKV